MTTITRYVVQAYCTGMGWTDTRYSSESWAVAHDMERELLANDSAWMPGERSTRIVLKDRPLSPVTFDMQHFDSDRSPS